MNSLIINHYGEKTQTYLSELPRQHLSFLFKVEILKQVNLNIEKYLNDKNTTQLLKTLIKM